MPKGRKKRSKPSAQNTQQQRKRSRTSTPSHPAVPLHPFSMSIPEESSQQSHGVLSTTNVATSSSDNASSLNEVQAVNPHGTDESQSVEHQMLTDIVPDNNNNHSSTVLSTEEIVNRFVDRCYAYLYKDPDQYAEKFYSEQATFFHENDDVQNDTLLSSSSAITTTAAVRPPRSRCALRGVDQIKNRIRELNFKHHPIKIFAIEHNVLANKNIAIVVRGEIENGDQIMKRFVQAFTLVPTSVGQEGYHILIDVFRYYNFKCFYDEPELYAPKTLVLAQNIDYEQTGNDIADNVKYLIQQLKSTPKEFAEAYQIEIQENDSGTYVMFLRINPVKWYDTIKKLNAKLATEFARKYVEKVENECMMSGLTETFASLTREQIHQIVRTEYLNKQCAIEGWKGFCEKDSISKQNYIDEQTKIGLIVGPTAKQYIRSHQSNDEHYMFCKSENMSESGLCSPTGTTGHHTTNVHFLRKRTEKSGSRGNWREQTTLEIHLPFQCRKLIQTLDRTNRFCLFYADPDYEIYRSQIENPSPDGFPLFFVSSRSQARPIVTLHPIKHVTQPEYVQSVDAWKAVLQTLAKIQRDTKSPIYPLQRIFINFGAWMTQRAADPTLYNDCHAHINIHLKPEIIDACTNEIFPSLVGSQLETENDRYEDATKRLLPLLQGP